MLVLKLFCSIAYIALSFQFSTQLTGKNERKKKMKIKTGTAEVNA